MTTIGDLGCPGIDVDDWRERNRAPLFPGKVNRWILVRTVRDNPTPDDLRNTLAAVFVKWFDGTPLDPAFTFQNTSRSGAADLIRLERSSKERLSFAAPAARREQLSGPLPTIRPGEVIWLEVSFAYRGAWLSMPWPVRTGAMIQLQSSAQCPIGADWMLDSVVFPEEKTPPELSTSDKAAQSLGDAAAKGGEVVTDVASRAVSSLWMPLAFIAGGAALFFVLRREYGRT